MNQFIKVILAVLGGVNTAFSICIPVFIALLVLNMYPGIGTANQVIILVGGTVSSVYRGLSVWIDLLS